MNKFNELYHELSEAFKKASGYDVDDFYNLQDGFEISKTTTDGGANIAIAYGTTIEDPAPTVVTTYWSDNWADPLYFVAYDVKDNKGLAKKVEKLFGSDKSVWDALTKLGFEYEDSGAYDRKSRQAFQAVQFYD